MAILNPSRQKYQVDYDDESGPMGFIRWSNTFKEFEYHDEKNYSRGLKDLNDIVNIMKKLSKSLQVKKDVKRSSHD